jgi:hypothetical protein
MGNCGSPTKTSPDKSERFLLLRNKKNVKMNADMLEQKKCTICGKLFTPSIRRPDQYVCLSPECQKERQLNNMRKWRSEKSASIDNESWKESCRRKSSDWRKKHQAYLKLYRDDHKEKRSEYMREYMRRYRKRNKAAGKKSDADGIGTLL